MAESGNDGAWGTDACAWRQWQSAHDLGAVDRATLFVLPAVYLNLRHLAPTDPALSRLRGHYRYAVSRTQIAVHSAAAVLRALHEAGVQATLLKGIPLALFHYRDPAARRMMDVDVLIRPDDVPAAAAALAAAGWVPKFHLPPKHLRRSPRPAAYTHPQWTELDLHWRPFTIDCPPDVEEQFHGAPWSGRCRAFRPAFPTRPISC